MDDSSLPARRLLIFGCGYLGRAVARTALEGGWQVEALTRNPVKADALRSELGLRVVEGELSSDGWHAQLDPAGATVVNCVSAGGGGEAGYARSYRDGMRSLIEWARGGAVRTLVYTGSTSVYPQTGGSWVDEASPTAGTTPFNTLLLETEALLRAAVASAIVPGARVLRLAGLYGPGRHHLIDQVHRGETELPGHGDYALNLIHRDDAAAAVLAVASAALPGFGIFNVADGNPATKAAIVQWTAARLGRPAPAFRPDRSPARPSRRTLFDGRPPDRRISANALRETLGWAPRYPDFRSGYGAILDAT